MIDTRIENSVIPEYIEKLNELKGKHDINNKLEWNKDILLKESINKKTINGKYLDSVTTNFLNVYLRWSIQAGNRDRYLKKAKARAYTEDLLKNGDCDIGMFIKEKGRGYTEELYRNVLFGTKD